MLGLLARDAVGWRNNGRSVSSVQNGSCCFSIEEMYPEGPVMETPGFLSPGILGTSRAVDFSALVVEGPHGNLNGLRLGAWGGSRGSVAPSPLRIPGRWRGVSGRG